MTGISAEELAGRLRGGDAPRLLDVRQPEEHAIARLPDSRLVPLPELPARLGELNDWRDEEIVVYCHHGIRSRHAGHFLAANGFRRLLNLEGGIDAWSLLVDTEVARY